MPGITGFEYDIFISYAHLDNELVLGQKDGWIEQFYLNLKLMLERRFKKYGTVKIWLDRNRLLGNTMFDKSIEENIEKSAIMISLNSTSYQGSEYCAKELKMFYEKVQKEPQGLMLGHQSRLVHVLLNNIPFTEWPKELQGTSGFHLHDATDKDDLGDPYDTGTKEYNTKMKELRDALYVLFKEFLVEEESKAAFDELAEIESNDDFSIYIGEVSDPLRSSKKRIINELTKNSFNVISGPPPPSESVAHAKATKEAINKSQLSIHLLDEYSGREIDGEEDNFFPKKQTEIALDLSPPQLIWMPSGINFDEIEEPSYSKFLKDIEGGEIYNKPYEFIKGSKGDLVQEIIAYTESVKKKREQEIKSKGPLAVLLDTHFIDQKYAFNLSQMLLDHNIQPFINPEEDDPAKNLDILSQRMSQVKKLVFLYGNVSKDWVTERMKAALQLIINNNYPISDIFVYMAPPHKEANDIEIAQNFLKVNVVNKSGTPEIDEASIGNFLKDLQISKS